MVGKEKEEKKKKREERVATILMVIRWSGAPRVNLIKKQSTLFRPFAVKPDQPTRPR